MYWIYLISVVILGTYGDNQYCLLDKFEATCDDNDVVVITSARYGRMGSGKCLGENADNLGCTSNELQLLDQLCSGKPSCNYVVGNNGLMQKSPCEKQLMVYLEVNYECVPVSNPISGGCQIDSSNQQGYISSYIATDKGCAKPWRINGKPGQRINITLIDFTQKTQGNRCNKKGTIVDIGIQKNITICGSRQREEQIYTSNGNIVDLILNEKGHSKDQAFLIKYQVLGCADLLPPDHGWYERSGDKAVLGCQHQDVKWHIQCENDQWQGVVGNCTGTGSKDVSRSKNKHSWSFLSEDNFILILICSAFGLILLIIICVLIYLSWGKCLNKASSDSYGQSMTNYNHNGPSEYVAPGWSASTFNHSRANCMYNPAPLLDAPLVEAPPPPQYSQTMGRYHQDQNSLYTNLTHPDSTLGSTRKDYQDPKYYVLDQDLAGVNLNAQTMQRVC